MADLTLVTTVAQARALAAELVRPGRSRPCVVVSSPSSRARSAIDAAAVHDQVHDVADVHRLTGGSVGWAFSRAMPHGTAVYGSAARTYPVALDWVHRPSLAPTRHTLLAVESTRALRDVVDDALGAAYEAGLLGVTVATHAQRVDGEVTGIVADRGMVRTRDGHPVTIVPRLTVPDVSAEQLLRVGQRVSGTAEAGRLDVRGALVRAGDLPYVAGDVVLARVAEVGEESARLVLHPELVVEVSRLDVTGNDLDRLADLLTEGEVLRARVLGTAPWQLRLSDLDDDEEARDAVALLPGGPPWLVEGVPDNEGQEQDEAVPGPRLDEDVAHALPVKPDPGPVPPVSEELPASRREATPRAESEPPPGPVRVSPATLARRLGAPAPVRPPHLTGRRPSGTERRDRITSRPDEPGRDLQETQAAPRPAPAPPPAETSGPRPAAAPTELATLRVELERVKAQLRESESELELMSSETSQLIEERNKALARAVRAETSTADLRKKLRTSRRQPPAASTSHEDTWFEDPVDQLRHEILDAWVRRIPRADKARRPLTDYTVGPRFCDDLTTIVRGGNVSRAKVVEVVVEVLAGLAHEMPARSVHTLRTNASGGAPPRTRPDGAVAWRASVQTNSASARRVHWWVLPDRSLELARVVTHDTYEM